MFKDSMEHLHCLALAETDSEDEEEDESDITLILSMIDELFRVFVSTNIYFLWWLFLGSVSGNTWQDPGYHQHDLGTSYLVRYYWFKIFREGFNKQQIHT